MVIPGGPGLASVLPYRGLRNLGARGGLDIIMVEHRGVGLSRTATSGLDLPSEAMRIVDVVDDIAAVLDRERVSTAYVVGSSYGSFLASTFGARYPERVAGMLLDSALQSTADVEIERQVLRDTFWNADTPTATLMHQVARTGVEHRELLDATRAAYELGGDALLRPLLRRRLKRSWDPAWLAVKAYSTRGDSIPRIRAIYEFDLAGIIGFRELRYGYPEDGLPLDPALTYAPIAHRFPAFESEPYDLTAAARSFSWPLVLLSGSRDMRTPSAIASRVADVAPDATLVSIENGHSALDTHPLALLNAVRWLQAGKQRQLPEHAHRLDALPLRGAAAHFTRFLSLAGRFETSGVL